MYTQCLALPGGVPRSYPRNRFQASEFWQGLGEDLSQQAVAVLAKLSGVVDGQVPDVLEAVAAIPAIEKLDLLALVVDRIDDLEVAEAVAEVYLRQGAVRRAGRSQRVGW